MARHSVASMWGWESLSWRHPSAVTVQGEGTRASPGSRRSKVIAMDSPSRRSPLWNPGGGAYLWAPWSLGSLAELPLGEISGEMFSETWRGGTLRVKGETLACGCSSLGSVSPQLCCRVRVAV